LGDGSVVQRVRHVVVAQVDAQNEAVAVDALSSQEACASPERKK
jgi:hypothetical protein